MHQSLKFASCTIATAFLIVNLIVFHAVEHETLAWYRFDQSLRTLHTEYQSYVEADPSDAEYASLQVEHDLTPQEPDWEKLNDLQVQRNATPHSYREFFLEKHHDSPNSTLRPVGSATSTSHPPPKNTWNPPRRRSTFVEWSDKQHLRKLFAFDATPQGRKLRFPSIDQRLRMYMSNWYHPPCSLVQDGHYFEYRANATFYIKEQSSARQVLEGDMENDRYIDVNSSVSMDRVFALNKANIHHCVKTEPENLNTYCDDIERSTFQLIPDDDSMDVPLLWQFGDGKTSQNHGALNVPHFRKIRSVADNFSFLEDHSACHTSPRKELATMHDTVNLQPVLWKLRTVRHYGYLPRTLKYDIPWESKKPRAIFRGALSGGNRDGYAPDLTPTENCKKMRRCRLVLDHDKSALVDARISKTLGLLPDTLDNGISIVDPEQESMSVKDQLKYQAIIMIEGNDVSSGLKWSLLSRSIVLMPTPTYTSWAMEELLEPWVHYVPLKDDLSNIEDQMRWVVKHEKEAKAISLRATLWMTDLVFHNDSAHDDEVIRRSIFERFRQHWSTNLPMVEENPMRMTGAGAEISTEFDGSLQKQ